MKKKNSYYKRQQWREKHKKQYTFTKTKMVAGFFLSVLSSIFLGAYFDRYGHVVLTQVVEAYQTASSDETESTQRKKQTKYSPVFETSSELNVEDE
jgi:hypothetical protein